MSEGCIIPITSVLAATKLLPVDFWCESTRIWRFWRCYIPSWFDSFRFELKHVFFFFRIFFFFFAKFEESVKRLWSCEKKKKKTLCFEQLGWDISLGNKCPFFTHGINTVQSTFGRLQFLSFGVIWVYLQCFFRSLGSLPLATISFNGDFPSLLSTLYMGRETQQKILWGIWDDLDRNWLFNSFQNEW